MQLGSVTFI